MNTEKRQFYCNVLLLGPFTPPMGGVATMNDLIIKIMDASGFNIIPLDTSYFKRIFHIQSITGFLNLCFQGLQIVKFLYFIIRYQCSIVHISVSSFLSFYKSTVFILISIFFRKKVIVHLHGGSFKRFFKQSPKTIQTMIQYILNRVHMIIALSQYWKNFLVNQINVDVNKVTVLYNCFDLQFANIYKSIADIETERREDPIRILFIGSLKRNKGIFDLITIAKQLSMKNDSFVIDCVGREGEKGIINKLKTEIIQKNLKKYFLLVGEKFGEEKIFSFLKSHIFILPSYVENFPVSIVEAMRSGLPVISTKVGAIPEIIQEKRHGYLINPGETSLFVNRLLELMGNPNLRRTMAENNIEKAHRDFNPWKYQKKLLKIYKTVMN